jgi:hypothetical protein
MAKLKDGVQFTGTIGNMTAYKRVGSDEIFLRKKGGPTKAQIKKSPAFERTRQQNSEFTALSKAAGSIRKALVPVKHLTVENFTAKLVALCRVIQQLEKVNDLGNRSVLISAQRQLLEGFRLCSRHPFPAVVTSPLHCSIDRAAKGAVIQLPQLIPDLNLLLPWKHRIFRFIGCLGLADDVVYKEGRYIMPDPVGHRFQFEQTPWHITDNVFAAREINLQLNPEAPLEDHQTLILSVGIEMGAPATKGIQPVKYAGAAIILATG